MSQMKKFRVYNFLINLRLTASGTVDAYTFVPIKSDLSQISTYFSLTTTYFRQGK